MPPDVRDWCKRLLYCLEALHASGGGFAVGGGNPFSDGALGGGGAGGGGGPRVGLSEIAPAFAGQLAPQAARPAAATNGGSGVNDAAQAPSMSALPGQNGGAEGASAGAGAFAGRLDPACRADAAPWGFPFAGPKAAVMANSRRALRQGAMHAALRAAMRTAAAGAAGADPFAAAGGSAATAGVALPSPLPLDGGSGLVLDNPGLWRTLGAGGAVLEALSAPSDPLALSAKYALSADNASVLEVQLQAENRWAVVLYPP